MKRGLATIGVGAVLILAVVTGCAKAPEPARFEVVYFHRTIRCPSCETLEAWAESAVAPDVEAGRIDWLTLNLDESGNAEFEDRYELTAQSVVLREMRGGREVRWKNLSNVWDLLDDETAFKQYVQKEVRDFTSGKPETTQ